MIIWLASYPKSGNTWVRLFINALFYSGKELDINNIEIQQFPNKKYFKNILENFNDLETILNVSLDAQYALNLDNKVKIIKTHSAFWKTNKNTFTNYENTLGVIHIVRDPRNVITSIKNHYRKSNYESALKFMTDERKFIGSENIKEEFDIPALISSWSNHYKSWSKVNKNYLLVKYEDLLKNPRKEFLKITEYLEKITDLKFKTELDKIINDCNFDNLQKQESQKGFIEAAKNQKFFFLGPKNNWKNILKKNISQEIEITFGEEMRKLKYL